MPEDINRYAPRSGRVIAEDGTIHNIVDLLGGGGSGGSSEQKVNVTNFPKYVGSGNILSGDVDPTATDGSYPKLIDAVGANAIEIQCPQDNTEPLLVSSMQPDFGDWEVYPGTSKVFHFSKLYVGTKATTTQRVTFMALDYK